MKNIIDKTIYSDLGKWAETIGKTNDRVLICILDEFCDRFINDSRLQKFFIGIDIKKIHDQQFEFISNLFSEKPSGGYSEKQIVEIHKNLINDRGLNPSHFEIFEEHFISSLKQSKVPDALNKRILKLLIFFKDIFQKATSRYASSREEKLFSVIDIDNDGKIKAKDLISLFEEVGFSANDERLSKVYNELNKFGNDEIILNDFSQIISSASLLIERAIKGELAIPDFSDFSQKMDQIFNTVSKNKSGLQAKYIRPLAEVNPEKFGIAVITADGQVYSKGDSQSDFSIQSMCKPLNYCFALEELGSEEVHKHVGNEPSGRAFNNRDLMERYRTNKTNKQQERIEIPYNPMINAGAIMTASLIKSKASFKDRFNHIGKLYARLIGKEHHANKGLPRFNKEMARQENFTGYNNLALGYLLMATGMLPHSQNEIPKETNKDPDDYDFIVDTSVLSALKIYFATCSLELTVEEMAMVAATLANGGICPTTQDRVLSQNTVRSCLSVTQMCGMYDGSGDFSYKIGLPAKSGIGGGVMLIVPKLMGICIFSPRLDSQGNSIRGVETAKKIIEKYRLHLYDDVMIDNQRIDPRLSLSGWQAAMFSEALWAANNGDIRTLQMLNEEQYDLEAGDYDLRTPMHLAAAEGHLEVVKFLLDNGVKPKPDRWGGYPISDAKIHGFEKIIVLFDTQNTATEPHHVVQQKNGPVDESAVHGDALSVVELLWAACNNDLRGVQRQFAKGVPISARDYDYRTALHLASSEGNIKIVKYLVAHGHPLNVRDRWEATPLDEAIRENRTQVINYLKKIISEKNK